MIITKYLGPTDHKGSRIKATGSQGSVTISRNFAVNVDVDYDRAVKAYCDKFDITHREFIRGCHDGCNFTYVPTHCPKVSV